MSNNNIEVEIPEGISFIEKILIEMIGERRSWNCRMEIAKSLSAIRTHAENLKKEVELLQPSIENTESPANDE